MKKILFILIAAIIFNFVGYSQCTVDAGSNQTIYCQGTVQLQAVAPEWDIVSNADFFSDIEVLSQSTIYAMNDYKIYKSSDKGSTWTQQFSTTARLMGFATNQNGYGVAVGYDGSDAKMYHTLNGNTWNYSSTKNGVKFWDVQQISDSYSYIIGNRSLNGVLYFSSDFGTTCTEITTFPGSGYTPEDLHFIDQNNGYICGQWANGKIWKTIDGGLNWTSKTTTSSNEDFQNLYAIYSINATTAIATGAYQSIYKTIDGGTNWTKIQQTGLVEGFKSITFFDETHGYIAGNNGTVTYTSDAGNTWTVLNLETSDNLYKIQFLSESIGYITSSNNKFYRKNTNTFSWLPAESLDNPNIANPIASPTQTTEYTVAYTNTFGCNVSDNVTVDFVDFETIIYGDYYSWGQPVQMTVHSNYSGSLPVNYLWDNASTLNNPNIPNPIAIPANVGASYYTVNATIEGTACTSSSSTYLYLENYWVSVPATYTANYNVPFQLNATVNKWKELYPYLTSLELDILDAHFINQNIGYVSFQLGAILKTTDAGNEWIPVNSPLFDMDIYGIYFIDENNGFICGEEFIYKTNDGGQTWNSLSNKSLVTFTDIYFIDANTGFIISDAGMYMKTTDGGNTWTSKTIAAGENVVSLNFLSDNQTGYIFTQNKSSLNATVYKTTDQGNNWTLLTEFINPGLMYDIFFIDQNKGFAVGTQNKFTIDGGATWNDINIQSNYPIFIDIHFVDNQTGYMLNKSGLYKTKDAGVTWNEEIPNGSTETLKKLNIITENSGYVMSSSWIYINLNPQFTWTPATYLSDATIQNPICTPTNPITYNIEVTTSVGCSANNTIFVDVLPSNVGEIVNTSVDIFPNPTSNFINISGKESFTNYLLINSTGQIILQNKITNNQINIKNINKGIYKLQLISAKGIIVNKTIVIE